MEMNNNERRYSSASPGTPGGDENLKATGEGESRSKKNDPDEDTPVSDGGRGPNFCRGSSNNKKRWKNKRINIGTWNVRTMNVAGKLHLLLQELTQEQMNITGLCEI